MGRATPAAPGKRVLDDEEDEDGAPRLPGGKSHLTSAGHARLREELAECRAVRHRVVVVVFCAAGNGHRSKYVNCKRGKRRLRGIGRRLRVLGRRLARAEPMEPAAQARCVQVFFGATVTYPTESNGEVAVAIVGAEEAGTA